MVRVLTARDLNSIRKLAACLEEKGLAAEGRKLRDIIDAGSERTELKASEAAAVLRVTPQTMRNWVRRGLLEGRTDQTGHLFIPVSALRPAIELDAAMPHLSELQPDVTDDEILAEIAAYRVERKAS